MDVVLAHKKHEVEKLTKLKEIKPGDKRVFRFPDVSFDSALSNDDGACFFMVIALKPEKADRVAVCSLDGKIVRECDADREIVTHVAYVCVEDPEMAQV